MKRVKKIVSLFVYFAAGIVITKIFEYTKLLDNLSGDAMLAIVCIAFLIGIIYYFKELKK